MQFVVADAGIGIPRSLRAGHQSIHSDADALDQAIREGVTRDPSIGQGNGLFGSFQICSKSRGDFLVDSGYARLRFSPGDGLSIDTQVTPYSGTLVVATIDFSDPRLLEDALSFRGSKFVPVDSVETRYVYNSAGVIHFKMTEEYKSFGNRVSGKPARQKLENLLRMAEDGVICADFDGVPILSSSFADEAIGKLFLAIGPIEFMRRLRLINMSPTVEALVNKAIEQRMKTGTLL